VTIRTKSPNTLRVGAFSRAPESGQDRFFGGNTFLCISGKSNIFAEVLCTLAPRVADTLRVERYMRKRCVYISPLRKIKRGVLPTYKPTQIAAQSMLPNLT